MATKTFHGSCGCKAVRFEADIDLAVGTTKCNCTSCWKRRWWSIKVEPAGFRLLQGTEQLTPGRRGFCQSCGVAPFQRVPKAEWNEHEYVSVNVAVLDDLDPRDLLTAKVQYCNGRDDDWWHAPEVTAHL